VAMVVNGLGAVATGIALAVILVAKFVEGAWVVAVLVPGILAVFAAVKHHYGRQVRQLACLRPLNLTDLEPPVVVVPVESWTLLTEKALRFGLTISRDVVAVHVAVTDEKRQALLEQWQQYAEEPSRQASRPAPRLEILESPYRMLFLPLIGFIERLQAEHPTRQIAVVIPELVQRRWYENFLHNHRAEVLKARLLLEDNEWVVLINIPWYLK